MRAKSKYFLLLSLFGLMLTSWLLFFRDERLLAALVNWYDWQWLLSIRAWLLAHGLNTLPTAIFGFFIATAFISYFFILRDQSLIRATSSKIRSWSFLFAAIIFFSFPVLSTDIFSYMASDRVLTAYSQNVWLVSPDNFPADKFVQVADWTDTTRVYGFINQLIYTPLSFLAGDNFFLAFFLYKLATLAGFVGLTFFLTSPSFASHHPSSLPANFISLAILFNPLFLLEIVGNAHNDIFMILFALLSIYFFTRHQFFLSALFAVLSVQVKIMLLIWVGFALLELLRTKKIKPFLIFALPFTFFNLLCFFFMRVTPFIFAQRVLFNNTNIVNSLAAVFRDFFHLPVPDIQFIFLIIFLLLLIFQLFRRRFDALSASAIFLSGYLLFFMSAYWSWYCLWLVMFLPFFAPKKIWLVWLVWTFTSLSLHPLTWLSYRFFRGAHFWPLLRYLWLVLPVLIALSYDKIRRYGSKKIRSSAS